MRLVACTYLGFPDSRYLGLFAFGGHHSLLPDPSEISLRQLLTITRLLPGSLFPSYYALCAFAMLLSTVIPYYPPSCGKLWDVLSTWISLLTRTSEYHLSQFLEIRSICDAVALCRRAIALDEI